LLFHSKPAIDKGGIMMKKAMIALVSLLLLATASLSCQEAVEMGKGLAETGKELAEKGKEVVEQQTIPFDGMYLKYKLTRDDGRSGERLIEFTGIDDPWQMKAHDRTWIGGEIETDYQHIIDTGSYVVEDTTAPAGPGKGCGFLWRVPVEDEVVFNVHDPETNEVIDTVTTRVVRETVNIIGIDCRCFMIKGPKTTFYIEVEKGVLVRRIDQKEDYEQTSELTETNIRNFPPPSKL
jgi:hypothetical protein